MSEYRIQGETLDAIADAINAKTGGSGQMTPAEMVEAIGNIGTGGGNSESASGEIVLESATSSTNLTVSGLSFTPNAVFVFGEASVGKSVGGLKFAGFSCVFTKVYANDPPSTTNVGYAATVIPDTLFNLDSTPSGYVTLTNDGFSVRCSQTSCPFEAGVTYYWKAWRLV